MGNSKEREIRGEIEFDSTNGEPLQVSWNTRIRNSLYACIPKSIYLFNQNRGFWKLRYYENTSVPKKPEISSKFRPKFDGFIACNFYPSELKDIFTDCRYHQTRAYFTTLNL